MVVDCDPVIGSQSTRKHRREGAERSSVRSDSSLHLCTRIPLHPGRPSSHSWCSENDGGATRLLGKSPRSPVDSSKSQPSVGRPTSMSATPECRENLSAIVTSGTETARLRQCHERRETPVSSRAPAGIFIRTTAAVAAAPGVEQCLIRRLRRLPARRSLGRGEGSACARRVGLRRPT